MFVDQEIIIGRIAECRPVGLTPKLVRRQAQGFAKLMIETLDVDTVANILAELPVSDQDGLSSVWMRHPKRPAVGLRVDLPARMQRWALEFEIDRARSRQING